MVQTVWIAALVAQAAFAARLFLSPRLRQRYRWLWIWLAAHVLTFSAALVFDGGSEYGPFWSYAKWPLMLLSALAVRELAASLARQYGPYNWGYLRVLSIALAAVFLIAAVGTASWIECQRFVAGDEEFVQITHAASRVLSLTLFLSLAASIILMTTAPLAWNRNCIRLRNTLALYFAVEALQRYLVIALVPIRLGTLDAINTAASAVDIVLFAWLAYAVRAAEETDWIPPAFSNGHLRPQDRLGLVRRGMKRLFQGSRTRYA